MSRYGPGDRVYVRFGGEGTEWWPAKVLDAEQAGIELNPAEGLDTAVFFYGDHTASMVNSFDTNVVVPFEMSSSKAVPTSEQLSAAMTEAVDDADANPVNSMSGPGATETQLPEAAAQEIEQRRKMKKKKKKDKKSKKEKKEKKHKKEKKEKKRRKDKKRRRDDSDDDDESNSDSDSDDSNSGSSEGGAGPTVGRTSRASTANKNRNRASSGASSVGMPAVPTMDWRNKPLMADELAFSIRTQLEEAVAEKSVADVRGLLSQCAQHSVTLKLLVRSSIGKAVGKVLCDESLKAAYPLAKAVINYWTSLLPADVRRHMVSEQAVMDPVILPMENASPRSVTTSPKSLEISLGLV